jgi:hypothetical protein
MEEMRRTGYRAHHAIQPAVILGCSPRGRPGLLRLSALVLVAIAAVAVFLTAGIGGEPLHRLETPVLRATPTIAQATQPETRSTGKVESAESPPRSETATEEYSNIRIGSFEKPEQAPEYEILESLPADRDGANAARLLVDTRSHSEEDFTLIARDLKARYSNYDAVSAQFTDTSDIFDYTGAALIFNTPAGASYIGYIYGPPNNRGYYVEAAE